MAPQIVDRTVKDAVKTCDKIKEILLTSQQINHTNNT